MWTFEFAFQISEPETRWEDTPRIVEKVNRTDWDGAVAWADARAQRLADIRDRQVRWEFTAVGQGHYVNPTKWVRAEGTALDQHPEFTIEAWVFAVRRGKTLQGYNDWVFNQLCEHEYPED